MSPHDIRERQTPEAFGQLLLDLEKALARAAEAEGKLAIFEQRTASAIYERNMAQSALAKAATIGANDLRRLLALLEAVEQADQHSSDGAPFYHLVVDADVRNALQDLPHLLLVVQRAVEGSR